MTDQFHTELPGKSLCDETLEKICDILEFQLGHVEGKKACEHLLEHVMQCPKCKLEVDTLARTIRVYQHVPPREVPVDVQSRLMNCLHLDQPESPAGS